MSASRCLCAIVGEGRGTLRFGAGIRLQVQVQRDESTHNNEKACQNKILCDLSHGRFDAAEKESGRSRFHVIAVALRTASL
jgi:hypothetical protein